MGKRIFELAAVSDADSVDNNKLLALGDAVTGIAGKMTIAQAKAAFQPKKLKYVADGSEGTAIVISDLAGKIILGITRESAILYEVSATPDPAEYIWDLTTITVSIATGAGERFNIIYCNS